MERAKERTIGVYLLYKLSAGKFIFFKQWKET